MMRRRRGIQAKLSAREEQSKTHVCSRSCVCSEEAVEREAPGEEGGPLYTLFISKLDI
jgi:hypothetical protein